MAPEYNSVICAMKMGNIVPRTWLKPTSLAFRANVLLFHHIDSLTSLLYPCPPVYAAPCLRGQCSLLHSPPLQLETLLMVTITYTQAMALHIHTQGGSNNHTVQSLYWIMVTPTSVMGVMKMGNIVPRVRLQPTSLAFCANLLSLSVQTTIIVIGCAIQSE